MGVTPQQLATLAPLAGLSPERLAELASMAVVERAPRGTDPLKDKLAAQQSVFLLSGELLLSFEGGGTLVVVGGTEETRQALNRQKQRLARSKAITDVDLLAVEDDVLDILATWDQVAAASGEGSMGQAVRSDARLITGAFSLGNLRSGAFAQLPVAHIDELLKRFERVKTARGDTVIREGDEGDYYYVVESGRFQVERLVGGAKVVLAELKSGDAFGEEALVSEAKRNASVISLGDGELLRLDRKHFNELLREPLLRRVGFEEAAEKVRRGALWLDVRYPSEYQYDKLPGAINVPLAEVRNMFEVLDRSKEYVAYCQSGRRSAAAAFLFAQRGFKVWLLEGGLRTVEKTA
jgi:rhodanese-related sulfurtransferase